MKNVIVVLCSIICIFLFACEDTTPSLGIVRHMVLYDYDSSMNKPTQRLAVYVEILSDPQKIQTIEITSVDSDLTWTIDEPIAVSDSSTGKVWLGSSNLLTPSDIPFSQGQYRLRYTDVAQRQVDLFFTIHDFLSVDDLNISDYQINKVAVFDALANIIYFGDRIGESELLAKHPNAYRYRDISLRDDYHGGIIYTSQFLQSDTNEIEVENE